MPRIVITVILFAATYTAFFGSAFAYMGPGAGLTAIGSLLAIVGVVFLAILGFLWYPIKRMFAGRSKAAPVDEKSQQSGE